MVARLLGCSQSPSKAALACFARAPDALAWGDEGHRIICEIALREVGETTRARIKQLLKGDAEFTSFADACTWPDHPRKRAAEHFVNLRRDAPGLAGDPCPTADRCVVSAISHDLAVLGRSDANAAQKLDALKYLSHWVGDVHQPLHVSFEDDRGGNGVAVTGLCGTGPIANLHSGC